MHWYTGTSQSDQGKYNTTTQHIEIINELKNRSRRDFWFIPQYEYSVWVGINEGSKEHERCRMWCDPHLTQKQHTSHTYITWVDTPKKKKMHRGKTNNSDLLEVNVYVKITYINMTQPQKLLYYHHLRGLSQKPLPLITYIFIPTKYSGTNIFVTCIHKEWAVPTKWWLSY